VREKNDKFQQRRLDGFFKAGVKACDEACEVEGPEQPAPMEVMAMEVVMEVKKAISLSARTVRIRQTNHHLKVITGKWHSARMHAFHPCLLDSLQAYAPDSAVSLSPRNVGMAC